jgi:hypothetical protein
MQGRLETSAREEVYTLKNCIAKLFCKTFTLHDHPAIFFVL